MLWRRARRRRERFLPSDSALNGGDPSSSPGGASGAGDGADRYAEARERMVRDQIEARGIRDPELLRAFRTVPRHLFVDSAYAYDDRALPVGEGQTISQPYIVAVMTDAARPLPGWRDARVLEVGTGSGYQAAILAELGASVITIERHPSLASDAAERLARLGYRDVTVIVGDGSAGHPEGAPYDSVIVTAAGPAVPPPLLVELRPEGGRLVMPVGDRDHQLMTLVVRDGEHTSRTELDACVFVPLLGTFGFRGDVY